MGLQMALDALNHYNVKNQLLLNGEKTKVLIFGGHQHKAAARWRVVHLSIKSCQVHNYLGTWLTERHSAQKQRAEINKKSGALIYLLKCQHQQLLSLSAKATPGVLRANLIPAVSYGHLAFPGVLDQKLDKIQTKAHKVILGIVRRARGARVRAELGLSRQDFQCKSVCINYYLATMRALPNSMKAVNRCIFEKEGSPWWKYLKKSTPRFRSCRVRFVKSSDPAFEMEGSAKKRNENKLFTKRSWHAV